MNRTAGSREDRKQRSKDKMRYWLSGNRIKKLQNLARLDRLLDKARTMK